MNTIKQKYNEQKGHAKAREIPFLLTFEEWWDIWTKSGHWEERGRKSGQYVMSRIGDVGPYSVCNVFIQTQNNNLREAQSGNNSRKGKKTGPQSEEHKQKSRDAQREAFAKRRIAQVASGRF